MRRFLSYIIIAMSALAIASCGHAEADPAAKAEQVLAKAEQCAAAGDDAQAFAYAISLTDTSEYDLLPSQLCRQALVLYRISNDGEDVERLVASLTCYERALATSPDSVEAFTNTLDTGERSDMNFIHTLNMRLNHPQVYSEYEEADSLSADSLLMPLL